MNLTVGVLCVLVAGIHLAQLVDAQAAAVPQQRAGTAVVVPAGQSTAARAQARKLTLEIAKLHVEAAKLRKERGLEGQVQRLAPGATALIAFAAAVLGLGRYFREQRASFRLRLEKSIEANLQRLADYGTTGMGWSARLVVALRNLEALCGQSPDPHAVRGRVTETIKHAVRDDLDLGRVDQATFDALCISHWLPYRDFLRVEAAWQIGLLDRYRRALRQLRAADDEVDLFLQHATWANRRFQSHTTLKETPYRHLQRLITGYRVHVSLLDADAPDALGRRAGARQMLADGLGNPALATQLLAEQSQ